MTSKEALNSQKARVLVLHGHAKSGSQMEVKIKFLRTLLEDVSSVPGFHGEFPGGSEFLCPTSPHRLHPADDTGSCSPRSPFEVKENDLDAWCWGSGDDAKDEIWRYEVLIQYLLPTLRSEAPFVGIVRFSTGAGIGLTLVSLAERGGSPEIMENFKLTSDLLPTPFRFVIFYRGVIASHPRYHSLYYPQMQTPALHFVGKVDTFLPKVEMLKFSERCNNAITVHHSGAHFVPKSKSCQRIILWFVRKQMR